MKEATKEILRNPYTLVKENNTCVLFGVEYKMPAVTKQEILSDINEAIDLLKIDK